MRKVEGGFALRHLAEPVVSLGLSLALGGGFGATIGRLMAVPSRPFNYVLKRLPPATQARCGSRHGARHARMAARPGRHARLDALACLHAQGASASAP